jgi:hypothetical protein
MVKNFLNKYLKNTIWHLFAGETYQVGNITATYWRYLHVSENSQGTGGGGEGGRCSRDMVRHMPVTVNGV